MAEPRERRPPRPGAIGRGVLRARARWAGAGRRRRIAAVAAAPVAALGVLFGLALLQPFHGEGRERVVVEVPDGAGIREIARLFDDKGVISSAVLFELRLTLAGKRGEVQAGHYTLKREMSYGDAIEVLSTPPGQRVIAITIPEGLSRSEVAAIVSTS